MFLDDRALLIDAPDHSETEDRFILLGMSADLRVLISARKANRSEQAQYSHGRAIRAITAMLRENLDHATSVIGLPVKCLAGAVYAGVAGTACSLSGASARSPDLAGCAPPGRC